MKLTLIDVSGIGPSTAQDLAAGGIHNAEDLANASISTICTVPGFGTTRATRIKAAASDLISRSATAAKDTPTAPEQAPEAATSDYSQTIEANASVEPVESADEEKPKKKAKKKNKAKNSKAKKGKSKKDKSDKKGKKRGKKAKQSAA